VADSNNNKIRKITANGTVSTLAGSGSWGSGDGQGTTASFAYPEKLAVDSSGNVYVANYSNIRKITASGAVTTIPGSVSSEAIGIGKNGNIYTASNNKILKFNPSITGLADVNQIAAGENHSLALKSDGTVFGWGSNAYNQLSFDPYYWLDSPAVQVSAGGRHSLALDSEGNILAWGDNTYGQAPWGSLRYLSRVVQVAAGGTHSLALTSYGSVVAWGNNANGQTNVPAGYTQASFCDDEGKGIAVDSAGNVYVADTLNNKIRKISANGIVTTLAGTGNWGSQDGPGSSATFDSPEGIAVDSNGNVYVADTGNGKIRKITSAGAVSTFVGSLWSVKDIAVSGTIVYVLKTYENKILKITSNGTISTLAGSGSYGSANGIGNAASFARPKGISVDANGNIYVADTGNKKIRKITSSGNVTTFAGSGLRGSANGQGVAASFGTHLGGLTIDSSGNLYVADTDNSSIRKITSNGTVSTLAGSGQRASTDGTGLEASFMEPFSIAFHSSGLYVAENYKIRKITTTGAVTTFAGAETYGSQDGVAKMATGNKITQIAAGGAHSLALTANGTVIAWGDNSSGQCTVPSGLTGVVQIAAGKAHSMAIKSDGSVVAWGNNTAGQRTIPTGISYPIQAAAGGAHSLLLLASGPAGAPEITVQPLSQLVYANSNATFSVTSMGANLTYQWLRNGATVAGATGATYKFAPTALNVGNYTVRVSNSLGNVTSSPATLELRPAAAWAWTNSGPSAPVQAGSSATFSVGSVTGPGTIAYQWLKNGVAISGKTSSALAINPVSITDGGIYNLNITTSAGTISTESKTLVVGDSGLVVYSMNATGNSTTGATKQAANFGGYLVRERSTGKSHFFWLDATKKTYAYELRSDLTEKSTGPFVGSTTALRGYVSEESDEEMLWFSGTDAVTALNTSIKTLAPSAMTGQINNVVKESSTSIEVLNVALALDTAQTLKARATDANAAATVTRITNEIKALGYK